MAIHPVKTFNQQVNFPRPAELENIEKWEMLWKNRFPISGRARAQDKGGSEAAFSAMHDPSLITFKLLVTVSNCSRKSRCEATTTPTVAGN